MKTGLAAIFLLAAVFLSSCAPAPAPGGTGTEPAAPETNAAPETSPPETLSPETDPPESTPPAATTDIFALDIEPPEAPNALEPLKIATYDKYNQPCHPKVLYFEEGWNGYEYWMAYTPYPYCYDRYENPSIAVSRDGVNWETPPGLVNPVSGPPPTLENSAHYSDPHILMNGDMMELWFRYNPSYGDGVNADSNGGVILRIVSEDGVNWTAPETMLPGTRENRDPVLSPVVMLEDGVYTMWYTKRDGRLYRLSSPDGKNWSAAERTDLAVEGYNVWHQDMIKTDLGIEIVFCARPKTEKHNLKNLELFYAVSRDGMAFTRPVKILSPSRISGAYDDLSIYRASLLKTGGGYMLYYSTMSSKYVWKISLAAGPSVSELTGYGRLGFPPE